jgi:hypothetical protein
MAEIAYSCPSCGRGYQVDASLAGKKARCKDCNEVSRIPAPSQRPAPSWAESELSFPCPRCGYGFRLAARLAGKRARCKQCGEVFRVPERSRVEPAQPASFPMTAEPMAADHPRYEYSLDDDEGHGEDSLAEMGPAPIAASVQPTGLARAGDNGDDPESIGPGITVGAARTSRPGIGRKGLMSDVGDWLGGRLKLVGLVVGLMLLFWAFSSLFPRAWEAGQALFGGARDDPNSPIAGGRDPELELADVAAHRLPLVRQHEQALKEMAQAFQELAQGYVSMRNPTRFDAGKADVARASQKLDQAGKNDAQLAKLKPEEKAVLASVVNSQLKRNAAGAGQALTMLSRTTGVTGDFGPLLDAIAQAQRQFDRDYPGDTPRPAVQIIMRKIGDPAQQKAISENVSALVEHTGQTRLGWGTEGETTRLKVTTVYSAADFASRITFGKVIRVSGRRIELDVPPPATQ